MNRISKPFSQNDPAPNETLTAAPDAGKRHHNRTYPAGNVMAWEQATLTINEYNTLMPMIGLYWAVTLGFYSAVVFAIWKLFQIGRDVSEIKEMLTEIMQGQRPHR